LLFGGPMRIYRNTRCLPTTLPIINVVAVNNQIWTLDHRRVCAYLLAGYNQYVRVKFIKKENFPKEIFKINPIGFGTPQMGQSIHLSIKDNISLLIGRNEITENPLYLLIQYLKGDTLKQEVLALLILRSCYNLQLNEDQLLFIDKEMNWTWISKNDCRMTAEQMELWEEFLSYSIVEINSTAHRNLFYSFYGCNLKAKIDITPELISSFHKLLTT